MNTQERVWRLKMQIITYSIVLFVLLVFFTAWFVAEKTKISRFCFWMVGIAFVFLAPQPELKTDDDLRLVSKNFAVFAYLIMYTNKLGPSFVERAILIIVTSIL